MGNGNGNANRNGRTWPKRLWL